MSELLAVEAKDVTKMYGSLRAVDQVSVQVAAGEVYGVLGPNGAGKTTILRMLFGLIRPDSGSIEVFGKTWDRDGVGVLDGVAGFIESPRFYLYPTGRQNLEGLVLLDGGGRPGHLDEVLGTVDLTDRAGDKVGGYSYGMRWRLGVAASLLREPRLLVLDEPANGLDPAGIRDMRALVKRLAASGLRVLLSSHHMDEVEEICDNVTVMRRGTVAFHGTITTLRSLAPDPGHQPRTCNDVRAVTLAADHPHVAVERGPDDGLVVTGPQHAVSSYVNSLVRAGVDLTRSPPPGHRWRVCSFMLTDDDRPGLHRADQAGSGLREAV